MWKFPNRCPSSRRVVQLMSMRSPDPPADPPLGIRPKGAVQSLEEVQPMNFFDRSAQSILALASLALLVSACADPLPSSPSVAGQDRSGLLASSVQTGFVRPNLHPESASPGITSRDVYSNIARELPGGFGGVYFDADGVLNVLLVDVERWPEARRQLEGEPLIQARRESSRGADFELSTARVVQANWPHDRLHDWLDDLLLELRAHGRTARISGVRVHSNVVYLGMASNDDVSTIHEIAARLSIPAEALVAEVVQGAIPLQTSVHHRIRPVPGGVQIRYGGQGICTIGPNIVRSPVGYPAEPGFLVASHCSNTPFQPFDPNNVTFYEQPEAPTSPVSFWRIGNRGVDVPLFPCVEHWVGCRNSDAATALYHSYASGDTARIAKPAGRNNSIYTLDPSTPRFEMIPYLWEWVTDGEVVEKVGRATGWTGGMVVDGCMTVIVTKPPPGYAIRCAMIVDAEAGASDSGAPVFRIIDSPEVQIAGTLFSGWGTCSEGADPIYTTWVIYCSQFAASNVGGILLDLDPVGNAPITFY